jgi:hypothetical protein
MRCFCPEQFSAVQYCHVVLFKRTSLTFNQFLQSLGSTYHFSSVSCDPTGTGTLPAQLHRVLLIGFNPSFTRKGTAPPLDPIMSNMSPVHIFTFTLLLISQQLGFINSFFLLSFPNKILLRIFYPPIACYMFPSSHIPWLQHPNIIWWRAQIMKLLAFLHYPVTSSVLGPSSSPLYFVVKHPQSAVVLCKVKDPFI